MVPCQKSPPSFERGDPMIRLHVVVEGGECLVQDGNFILFNGSCRQAEFNMPWGTQSKSLVGNTMDASTKALRHATKTTSLLPSPLTSTMLAWKASSSTLDLSTMLMGFLPQEYTTRSKWQLTAFKTTQISHIEASLHGVSKRGTLVQDRHHSQSQRIRAPTTTFNLSPFMYTVVRSDDANAFVLPGNHIFVLTGLFKYAHNEDELASILGHETAQNLARHTGEHVSQNLIIKMLSHLASIIDPRGLLFSIFVAAEALSH
ncbi:hypothetical protein HJC23_011672 [Cyclotella cryptica]|uniref:Peptidase M48 domain-containing protein n=1 Tax=Cyclotella cryptica TaxID=29204 RepID=A0ABD3QJI4_9STRA